MPFYTQKIKQVSSLNPNPSELISYASESLPISADNQLFAYGVSACVFVCVCVCVLSPQIINSLIAFQ